MTVPTGRFGVIVVNYASHALLARHLARVGVDAGTAVVVVDNRSTPAELEAVRALGHEHGWHVVASERNDGFGAGVRLGAAAARSLGCDALLLLNPDVAVGADVVAELAAAVRRDPLALVSPRLLRPDGSTWFAGATLSLRTGRTRAGDPAAGAAGADEEPWLPGTCLALHGSLWERLGGFDPDYFMYWEDVDLSHRCLALGGRVVVRADLAAVHDVGGTQGSGKSALYYRENCRGRLVFAAKHLGRRRAARWLLASPAATRRILLRGGRRQFVRRPGLALAGVRGTASGAAFLLLGRVLRRRSVHPSGRVAVAQGDVPARTPDPGPTAP